MRGEPDFNLDSERNSEKSFNQSNFGNNQADFMDDQSSIQQINDTEMNLDDALGFVIVLNENQAIGVTIETCQFVYFTYDNTRKSKSH